MKLYITTLGFTMNISEQMFLPEPIRKIFRENPIYNERWKAIDSALEDPNGVLQKECLAWVTANHDFIELSNDPNLKRLKEVVTDITKITETTPSTSTYRNIFRKTTQAFTQTFKNMDIEIATKQLILLHSGLLTPLQCLSSPELQRVLFQPAHFSTLMPILEKLEPKEYKILFHTKNSDQNTPLHNPTALKAVLKLVGKLSSEEIEGLLSISNSKGNTPLNMEGIYYKDVDSIVQHLGAENIITLLTKRGKMDKSLCKPIHYLKILLH